MGNSQEKAAEVNPYNRESPVVTLHKTAYQYLLSSNADNTIPGVVAVETLKGHLLVPDCNLADLILDGLHSRLATPGVITEEEYVDLGQELGDLNPGSRQFTEYFTDLLTGKEGDVTRTDVQDILNTTFCMACTINQIDIPCQDLSSRFQPLLDSMFGGDSSTSVGSVASFVQRHCPLLYAPLHTWLVQRWKTPAPHKHGQKPEQPLIAQMTENKSLLTVESIFLLSSTLPLVYSSTQHSLSAARSLMSSMLHWMSLYDSNLHGLSANRFYHHVFSYQGPTVSVLAFQEHVYLLAAEEEWRDSVDRWGGQSCQMIELAPKFRIIQGGAPLFFLNLTSRSVPKGFQFGKDSRSVMLEVDEDMIKVKHYGIETKLERYEVWGCGSETVRLAQLEQKRWEQGQVDKHKNRKLNLDDWKNSPDRMLLEMGGIKVTHSEEHRNEPDH